jgi:DNA helicase II / ATP-dependent DNA helicase PcrA
MFHGNTMVNEPSRFLYDIPSKLWDESGVSPRSYLHREFTPVPPRIEFGVESARTREPVSQAFTPGDRVRHKIFGTGTILSSTLTGDDEMVEVEFSAASGKVTKKLLVSFAGLEAIEG